MHEHRLTVEDAFSFVRMRRNQALPKTGFQNQLQAYQKRLGITVSNENLEAKAALASSGLEVSHIEVRVISRTSGDHTDYIVSFADDLKGLIFEIKDRYSGIYSNLAQRVAVLNGGSDLEFPPKKLFGKMNKELVSSREVAI
jgi:hypothetical protein